MLEARALLVGDWMANVRSVHDADSGMLLGKVCRLRLSRCWRRLIHDPPLAVTEAQDESLIFTAQRVWKKSCRTNVLDADGRHVGSSVHFRQFWPLVRIGGRPFSGWIMLDRLDRTVGYVSCKADGGECWNAQAQSIGMIERVEQGQLLHLPDDWNPFARMILLSTLLAVAE